MKHLFIVNPVAGGKDRREYVAEQARRALEGSEDAYELYVTTAPMDACAKIAAEAASGEELRVYACGGDGTLNECVNGAVGRSNVTVTHFPCGTGNDFIKMFGEEKARFSDLADLVHGEVRPFDIIECCGRYAVNICSVGIDARIGTEVHQYHDSYVLSVVANLFKGIAQPLTVRGCGMEYSGGTSLICACNGRFYGGGFNPIPDSMPDNGKLEFLVVRDVSRLTFIRLVGKYAKGRYRELEQYITHLEGDHLEIDSENDRRQHRRRGALRQAREFRPHPRRRELPRAGEYGLLPPRDRRRPRDTRICPYLTKNAVIKRLQKNFARGLIIRKIVV